MMKLWHRMRDVLEPFLPGGICHNWKITALMKIVLGVNASLRCHGGINVLSMSLTLNWTTRAVSCWNWSPWWSGRDDKGYVLSILGSGSSTSWCECSVCRCGQMILTVVGNAGGRSVVDCSLQFAVGGLSFAVGSHCHRSDIGTAGCIAGLWNERWWDSAGFALLQAWFTV